MEHLTIAVLELLKQFNNSALTGKASTLLGWFIEALLKQFLALETLSHPVQLVPIEKVHIYEVSHLDEIVTACRKAFRSFSQPILNRSIQ